MWGSIRNCVSGEYKLCERGSPYYYLYQNGSGKKTSSFYTPIFLSLFYLSVLNCFILVLVLRVFYLCCLFILV